MRITLDSATLRTALLADRDQVAASLSGTGGLLTTLAGVVEGFADDDAGLIADRTDGIDKRLDDLAEQRLALDERIAALEERLARQFSAMDALVARLNGTSSFLAQQLANLPGSTSRTGS